MGWYTFLGGEWSGTGLEMVWSCNLGVTGGRWTWLGMVASYTLGDWVGEGSISGILSMQCNCVANAAREFLTGSHASKFGLVVEVGWHRLVTVLLAACFKKSFNFTCGCWSGS